MVPVQPIQGMITSFDELLICTSAVRHIHSVSLCSELPDRKATNCFAGMAYTGSDQSLVPSEITLSKFKPGKEWATTHFNYYGNLYSLPPEKQGTHITSLSSDIVANKLKVSATTDSGSKFINSSCALSQTH